MVLFAISAFGCTLPHLIYGNQLLHANNAFYGGHIGSLSSPQLASRSDAHLNLCRVPDSSSLNGTSSQGKYNF